MKSFFLSFSFCAYRLLMPLKVNYVTNFLFLRAQGIPPVYIVAFQKLLSQVNHEFKTMGTMI